MYTPCTRAMKNYEITTGSVLFLSLASNIFVFVVSIRDKLNMSKKILALRNENHELKNRILLSNDSADFYRDLWEKTQKM